MARLLDEIIVSDPKCLTTTFKSTTIGKVVYGGGKFVILSRIPLVSYDGGLTWDSGNESENLGGSIFHCMYITNTKTMEEVFVALGNRYMRSDDGLIWSSFDYIGDAVPAGATAYGNGVLLTILSSGYYHYSDIGYVWTKKQSDLIKNDSSWQNMVYTDNNFVALSKDKAAILKLDSSYNLTCDIVDIPPIIQPWKGIAYGDGKIVAVGSNSLGSDVAIYSGDGGYNWVQTQLPTTSLWNYVTYGNGRFIATTKGQPTSEYSYKNTNIVASSTDGINWDLIELPYANTWDSVVYGDGNFLVVRENSVSKLPLLKDTDRIILNTNNTYYNNVTVRDRTTEKSATVNYANIKNTSFRVNTEDLTVEYNYKNTLVKNTDLEDYTVGEL